MLIYVIIFLSFLDSSRWFKYASKHQQLQQHTTTHATAKTIMAQTGRVSAPTVTSLSIRCPLLSASSVFSRLLHSVNCPLSLTHHFKFNFVEVSELCMSSNVLFFVFSNVLLMIGLKSVASLSTTTMSNLTSFVYVFVSPSSGCKFTTPAILISTMSNLSTFCNLFL